MKRYQGTSILTKKQENRVIARLYHETKQFAADVPITEVAAHLRTVRPKIIREVLAQQEEQQKAED
jgi:hypothetical protein